MDGIDFPCSPLFAAAYAEQGLTPPLPVGFPVDPPPPKWEPLPILDLNEKEWAEQGGALLELIGWVQLMAQTETPDTWHNHLPGSEHEETPSTETPLRALRPQQRGWSRPQRNGAKPEPDTPTPEEKEEPRPAPRLEGRWRHL